VQPFIATLAIMSGCARNGKICERAAGKSPQRCKILTARTLCRSPEHFSYESIPHSGGNLAVVTVIFFICLAIVWLFVARHRRAGNYLHWAAMKKPRAYPASQ
jgi:ribose/xylose/arabinose/galactoside ABC-type transport system permease subunit